MALALAEARAAGAAGEVPVGAVLIRNGELIAVGRNAPVASHDPSAHAEIRALRDAAAALGNYRLDACELFVTLEPCAMCAGALVTARVNRVVFGAHDERFGGVDTHFGIGKGSELNHRIEFVTGILADESRELLRNFFRAKRK